MKTTSAPSQDSEVLRCCSRRHLHVFLINYSIGDNITNSPMSLTFGTIMSKTKTVSVHVETGEQQVQQSITFPYIHHYKTSKGSKTIAKSKVSLQMILYSGYSGKITLTGVGNYVGRDIGDIDVQIDSLPIECDKVGDDEKYKELCNSSTEFVNEIIPKEKKKTSKSSAILRVIHFTKPQKKELRRVSPVPDDETEAEGFEHDDISINQITSGIVFFVPARKKRSQMLRKILEGYDVHFIEIANGDFTSEIIPFLLNQQYSFSIVLCGGDWFLAQFIQQFNTLNSKRNTNEVIPYVVPTTKNCSISKLIGKKDATYEKMFNKQWFGLIETGEEIIMPFIVHLHIFCENKTVTIDYWKVKKDKSQASRIKKTLDSIEIIKYEACDKVIDKDIEYKDIKIIVSSEEVPLKIMVDRTTVPTLTHFVTIKSETNTPKSFVFHTFA
ncbi:DAGKc domain-containing protein [Entamoeba marina]